MHYPRSLGEFRAWFSTDAAYLDYLERLRWPRGFLCSHCGQGDGWRLGDGRFMCTVCGHRTSVTAGTIFDRTRTPLSVWFTACWLFATAKDGTSALGLQRALEIGSYQTAWAMLHRLRSVLVAPGRDRLMGTVEVDETYIGGEETGLRGGRAKGKKALVGIAVELKQPRGFGRCRMAVLLEALVSGTRDPEVLAELARRKLRRKIPELQRALVSRFSANHALIVSTILAKLDFLGEAIAGLTDAIEALIGPFEVEVALLDTIPGRRSPHRRVPDRRDRCRHEPLSDLGPPLLVGGDVPR